MKYRQMSILKLKIDDWWTDDLWTDDLWTDDPWNSIKKIPKIACSILDRYGCLSHRKIHTVYSTFQQYTTDIPNKELSCHQGKKFHMTRENEWYFKDIPITMLFPKADT